MQHARLSLSRRCQRLAFVTQLENGTYKLSKREDTRQADQLHGLFR